MEGFARFLQKAAFSSLSAVFLTGTALADSMTFVARYNDGDFPGNPARGAEIKLRNAADQVFAEGVTDENGRVTIEYDPASPSTPQPEPGRTLASVSVTAETPRPECRRSFVDLLSDRALISVALPCSTPPPPLARYLGGFNVSLRGQVFRDGNGFSVPGPGRTVRVYFEVNGVDLGGSTNQTTETLQIPSGQTSQANYTSSGEFVATGVTGPDGRFQIATSITLPPVFAGTVRVTRVRLVNESGTGYRELLVDRAWQFNDPDHLMLEAGTPLNIGGLGFPELSTEGVSLMSQSNDGKLLDEFVPVISDAPLSVDGEEMAPVSKTESVTFE